MTDLWRAPGPHPVEVHGGRVSYTGQAAADAAALMAKGIEALEREARGLALTLPPRYRQLVWAAEQAAGDRPSVLVSPVTSSDVTNRPFSAASDLEVVGLEDAARRLGRGRRTARRVLEEVGVRVGVGRWQIRTQDFQDQIDQRRAA